MDDEHERRRLIEWLREEMDRATGRRKDQLNPDALDVERLRELQRLLRDLDSEHRSAIQRARATPWRR